MGTFVTVRSHLENFFKSLQAENQLFHIFFQLFIVIEIRCSAAISAQDEIIQRHMVQFRELDEQVNRTALFARLNAAIKATVDIQCFRNLFLRETVFDAELPNTISALFHVIIQLCNLQSVNLWVLRFEIRDHGYFAM